MNDEHSIKVAKASAIYAAGMAKTADHDVDIACPVARPAYQRAAAISTQAVTAWQIATRDAEAIETAKGVARISFANATNIAMAAADARQVAADANIRAATKAATKAIAATAAATIAATTKAAAEAATEAAAEAVMAANVAQAAARAAARAANKAAKEVW